MQKYLKLINERGVVYELPLEIVADIRASLISLSEPKEYNKMYEKEFESGMENNHLILDWAKEKLDWEDIRFHVVKMDVLRDDTLYNKTNWKENLEVVYH